MALSGGFLLIGTTGTITNTVKVFDSTIKTCDGSDVRETNLQRASLVEILASTVRVLSTNTAQVQIAEPDRVMIFTSEILVKIEGIQITIFRLNPRSFNMRGQSIARGSTPNWVRR